jgi:superfamily II DNA or RNA helicase
VERKPRSWQGAAIKALRAHDRTSFLLEACPGAGKTFPGLRWGWEQLDTGRAGQLIVIVPTTNLARQWAKEAAQSGSGSSPTGAGSGCRATRTG